MVYSVVWYIDFTQAFFTVKMTRASLITTPVQDWLFCNLPPPHKTALPLLKKYESI
jgi:hypothetical protein